MDEKNIIYQLTNLVNNFELDLIQRDTLLDYFSHVSKAHQLQIYFILIKNPDFIKKLAKFITQEKEIIGNSDEEGLLKIFTEEFEEIEKYI